MKEATGEVSMTMITIVAVGVIGAILALFWQPITDWIQASFFGAADNAAGDAPELNGGLNKSPGAIDG